MKTIFTILSIMFTAISVMAQPVVHLGLTTGFNSTFVLDKGLSQDPRYISNANYEWAPIGFSAGVDFNRHFGLQLESIKAAQGQIFQMIETAQQIQTMIAERNIDLSYLQIPLLMKMMGGNGAARFNFQIGPQLSLLNSGSETMKFVQAASVNLAQGGDIPLDVTTVMVANQSDIPPAYLDAINNGQVTPPNGNNMEVPLEYFQDPSSPGMYNMPQDAVMTLMQSGVDNEIQKFKDKEIQLAFGFGVDVDVIKQFYISANVRANYSFTDMRNQDLIDMISKQDLNGLFGNRANLLVGAQIGLHWVIGGNRTFRAAKAAAKASEDIIR